MNVVEAIKNRKSVRAFLDQPVEDETIVKILDAARWAASGTNTQPWEVAVVSGETKVKLQQQLVDAFESGMKQKMDYQYYPAEWVEPFRSRRIQCGLKLYKTLAIKREDTERRKSQWIANYKSFDSPVMLLFFIDKIMDTGSYLDYGMFLQSIMISAMEYGLATCPQAALGEYPDIVRDNLGYDENKIVVCGMALGYEDSSATVNSYRTDREETMSFTGFYS
jgi:nitroreductase